MSGVSSAPDRSPDRIVRPLDWIDPAEAFVRLCRERLPVWLDSAGPVGPRSRHSYLCVDPVSVLERRGGHLALDGRALPGWGFEALAALLRRWRRPFAPAPVPFAGGAVGLLGYGLGREQERLASRHAEDPDLPDLWIGLYDLVMAFDRAERRCWLIAAGLHPVLPAERRAAWLQRRLDAPPPSPRPMPRLAFRSGLDEAGYRRMVQDAIGRIRAGEMFQANLSVRHAAPRPPGLDAASVHLALRRVNPAPFGAFIGWEEGRALCSASPERFLRLDREGRVQTRPIKGTASRAADPVLDRAAAEGLSASVKDRAENLMIVDLMRNDLSRVALVGSVSVPSLCGIESTPTLHHLVSVVEARLGDDADAVALLRASFPGGSVTGAPKIRSMQVIDALEASARGPYCGSVVWIGLDGAMDSSIVIRTLLLTRGEVVAQAGGGIVSDSDPDAEHREMLAKLAPLLSVFR